MGSYQKPGSKTVKKTNQGYEQVGNPQKTDQETQYYGKKWKQF
jgi:hypothetical protein